MTRFYKIPIIGHSFIRLLLNYRLLQKDMLWVRGGVGRNRRVHLIGGLQMSDPLVPAEWNMSRAVPSLLDQGLVELPAGPGMDSSPAIFTVILQTRHVSTEERGELPAAAGALTLVTQLIVQDIWLNFHLQPQNETVGHSSVQILNSTPVF